MSSNLFEYFLTLPLFNSGGNSRSTVNRVCFPPANLHKPTDRDREGVALNFLPPELTMRINNCTYVLPVVAASYVPQDMCTETQRKNICFLVFAQRPLFIPRSVFAYFSLFYVT